jgi:hypothetical protein
MFHTPTRLAYVGVLGYPEFNEAATTLHALYNRSKLGSADQKVKYITKLCICLAYAISPRLVEPRVLHPCSIGSSKRQSVRFLCFGGDQPLNGSSV